jgi:hypothetical protein
MMYDTGGDGDSIQQRFLLVAADKQQKRCEQKYDFKRQTCILKYCFSPSVQTPKFTFQYCASNHYPTNCWLI